METLSLSVMHFAFMCGIIFFVLAAGIYAARDMKSSEGYSVGGRKSSAWMVAGSIAGTIVGGGATIGTAQMASVVGLPAWWFTLGSGIAFIIMGIFYAKPLRKTSLTTIPQYLGENYGETAEMLSSCVSSLGILLSAVASCLPGIAILSTMLNISPAMAAIVLAVLVALYVFFGGMKSAGVGGILKMAVIWVTLCIAGVIAFQHLPSEPNFSKIFPVLPWQSLFGESFSAAMTNLFSMIVGILCTQTYIQSIFSASSPKVASLGAFISAAIVIPVGLPSVAVGMFMHVSEPTLTPLLVLPKFFIEYLPDWLGGIALGGIMLSLISSIGGLSLGIGTMITQDILAKKFPIPEKNLLNLSRIVVVCVMIVSCVVAIFNLKSQVLVWNFLSMALRGAGIFFPLSLAVFLPNHFKKNWVVRSIILSTVISILAALKIIILPMSPLFAGLLVSVIVILFGWKS